MSYTCGVCKKSFEGSPQGAFVTLEGEILTCSGDCFLEGVRALPKPVTLQEMNEAQQKNKPSN